MQAIGSWARYLCLGTQAEADDEHSWNTGYWRLGWCLGFKYRGSGIQAEADDAQSWNTIYWQLG